MNEITEAMVDAGARKLHDLSWGETGDGKESAWLQVKHICREQARAVLSAAPTQAAEPVVIDLDATDWQRILAAVEKSKWMPSEYYRNDWMSDICDFLENGPPVASPEPVRDIDAGRFEEWSLAGFAGQCRMQSREQLDPEFSQFMAALSQRLFALSARPTPPCDGRVEVVEEAEFLLTRLSELEWTDVPKDFWRDWNGHVEPSISRLRQAIRALTQKDKADE